MYEYGALKHAEVILRRGMNTGRKEWRSAPKHGIRYVKTKCHNQTPCITFTY
jgi:hypothetical protein